MSITSLKIENFKSLGDIDLNIGKDKKVICFVGENGSSKTSILGLLVDGFISSSRLDFPDFSVKNGRRYRTIAPSEVSDDANFYRVKFIYEDFFLKEYSYNRVVLKEQNFFEEYNKEFKDFKISANNIHKEAFTPSQTNTENFFLYNVFLFRPSYRYEYDGYEVEYLKNNQDFETNISSPEIGDFPYNFKITHSGYKIESTLIELLLDSYIGYSDSKIAFREIPRILKEITQKDYGHLQISRTPYRRLISSTQRNINGFSQGELDLLVTISGIMERQLYIYNSHNNEYINFLQVPGLVIIDEVDLHLHPKAQESYLKILTDTFPNIQFIITTHSPFVIRGLPKNSVVVQLPTGNIIDQDFSTMDIDSITDRIFNLSGRFSEEVEKDLKDFKSFVMETNDIDKAKEIYSKYKHSSSIKNELDMHISFLNPETVNLIIG